MNAFRIGRISGIAIEVDWSWLLIFALLTWSLSTVFTGWHPDWPASESIGVALVASLLFFGCVLLHELAHALVARRYGLHVGSITLFMFGGVSNLEREPPSARAEFFTAVAGPVASILLGVAVTWLAVASTALNLGDAQTVQQGLARLGPIETLLVWLGPINVAVGAFNMIPAFPLDGGRVLRSILWGASGDLRTSTRRASAVGLAFGWLFVGVGILMAFGVSVPLFGAGLVGGVWLVLIGWFLRRTAAASYQHLAIEEALAGHTVSELMQRDGVTVLPELPVAALVHQYIIPSEERVFPVVRGGKLLGLVSVDEVRSVPPDEWAATPVGNVMRHQDAVVVATPQEPLAQAMDQLAGQNAGQLPVLDDHGEFVGVLRRSDVARWLEIGWSARDRETRGLLGDGPQRRHAS